MQRIPMTKRGSELLQQELDRLKHTRRPEIIKSIEKARAFGDLKENAEYHDAKEQQGFIEGRIQEIEAKLSHAQIIDVSTMINHGKVIFGSTIKLLFSHGECQTYQIVGDDEADIEQGLISINSPLARALIGKQMGDDAVIQTPGGRQDCSIDEVQYL